MTFLIDPPLKADVELLKVLRTYAHTPSAERAVALFSRSGEHAASWFVIAGLGLACSRPGSDRRTDWARAVGATAAAYGVNTAIKYRVRRRRPRLDGLPPLTSVLSDLSFPSAHSTTSFAAATALSKLLPAPLVYSRAGAYGLSRPYLGVHYPSDVVAGATLGTVIGLAARAGR